MPPFFWSQKQDIGPSPRAGHAMVLDALRNQVVLFGGATGDSAVDETWTWDGSLWTQAADTGPSARFGHALAFDATRNVVVLFGGRVPGGGPLDDTWTWDGTLWTQVADTGPMTRSGHAMSFDSTAGQVILFGGIAGAALGDTWTWDGAVWTQVQDVGPSARSGHAMAAIADPQRRALVYGGFGADGIGLADTWAWNGAAWTEIQDMGPGPRIGASMIGVGPGAILFGGVDSVSAGPADRVVSGDTWRWDPGTWTQLQDIGPRPRFGHSMATGLGGGRLTIFGGSSSGVVGQDPIAATTLLADTWEAPVEAGVVPGQQGVAGTEVDGVSILGDNHLYPAMQLAVQVTLTASVPVPVQLEIHIYRSNGLEPPLDPPYLIYPLTMQVPAGMTTAAFTIAGTAALPPTGTNQVAVKVQGSLVMKMAPFLLRG